MLNFKWSRGNAKLDKLEKKLGGQVWSFSLLSGWTCPQAEECLAKVVIEKGRAKVKDGPDTEFRCFSASQEALYPGVYQARKFNTDLVKEIIAEGGKGRVKLFGMLSDDLIKIKKKRNVAAIRLHVAGDFFSRLYFETWAYVAKHFPDLTFYGYTKCLETWISFKKVIPDNMILTASYGGREDDLIEKNGLRYARVVYSEAEANKLGLEIDHDDSHAAVNGPSFGLLIHGLQPKNSEASKALQILKKNKVEHSYSRG